MSAEVRSQAVTLAAQIHEGTATEPSVVVACAERIRRYIERDET